MHFHWDICFSGGERGRRMEGKEVDRYWTEGWVKQDDEQASCNGWTFDYGNIECGNEMFIRCGFEGERGETGEQREGWEALIWLLNGGFDMLCLSGEPSGAHLLFISSLQTVMKLTINTSWQREGHVGVFGDWYICFRLRLKEILRATHHFLGGKGGCDSMKKRDGEERKVSLSFS